MKKKIIKTLLISFPLIFLILALFVLFTPMGSAFLVRQLFSLYSGAQVKITRAQGNLINGLVLEGVEIKGIKNIGIESEIKIQKIKIYFTSLSKKGINLEVFNSRLNLKNLDQLNLTGKFQDLTLDFNLYAKQIGIEKLLSILRQNKLSRDLNGKLSNLDIFLIGEIEKPLIYGKFKADGVTYNNFTLKDSDISFTLNPKDFENNLKLNGEIEISNGKVFTKNSAVVELEKSRIFFVDNPYQPFFDLKGNSQVGSTRISIVLKGTIKEPEIKLASLPSLAQSQIMLMLLTNQSWSADLKSISQNQIPVSIIGDFIDYFLLNGSASKLSQYFGVNISADSLNKVSGEYKVSDGVYLGGQKDVTADNNDQKSSDVNQADDKVYLKYKNDF